MGVGDDRAVRTGPLHVRKSYAILARPGRPVYKSHTTRSSSASPALCAMTEARTARVEDRHSSVEPSQLYAARKARLSTAFNAVPRVAVRAIGSAALANRRKSSVSLNRSFPSAPDQLLARAPLNCTIVAPRETCSSQLLFSRRFPDREFCNKVFLNVAYFMTR